MPLSVLGVAGSEGFGGILGRLATAGLVVAVSTLASLVFDECTSNDGVSSVSLTTVSFDFC